MPPRTALLIVSIGHSGTTVLDMAIGAHPDAFSLGEVKMLHRAIESETICTCGEPVTQCRFWAKVIETVETRSGRSINELNVNDGSGDHRTLWDAAFDIANERVLVDSSIILNRARRVRDELSDHYRVLVLHIIRDIRSWALAREQAYERTGRTPATPDMEHRTLGERWAKGHVKVRNAGSEQGWDYMRIRHEDLCADPAGTLADIYRWADLAPHPFDGELSGEYHLFWGNPVRRTVTHIEPVQEPWRSDRKRRRLRTYGRYAADVARAFGYS